MMETPGALTVPRRSAAERRRILFAVAAFGLGATILALTGLIQVADRLPAVIRDNRLFVLLAEGYASIKPLLTGYSGPRYLGLLGVGVGVFWLLPVRWRRPFLTLYSVLLAIAVAHLPVLLVAGILAGIVVVHWTACAAARRREIGWIGAAVVAALYLALLALPRFVAGSRTASTIGHYLILQGYFMFLPLKFIHYLWDLSAGRAPAYSLKTLLLWMFFFPSFRNAPFERIQSFAAQTEKLPGSLSGEQIGLALKRLLVGGIKGAVGTWILTRFSPIGVWAAPTQSSIGQLWLAAYGYAVGMYLEFGGFADAMIGSSLLLGYRLSENFNRPYLQYDVRNFWRGWNITTSHWLRDYVYIPLGGSRHGNVYVNLLVTMLVAGVWHALDANFIIWGAWHGLGLVVSRYLFERRRRAGRPEPSPRFDSLRASLPWVVGVLLTFHFAVIGWIFHHNGYYGVGAVDSLRMVARMLGLRF